MGMGGAKGKRMRKINEPRRIHKLVYNKEGGKRKVVCQFEQK